MSITLDSNLAEELVKFKLKSIQNTINTILEKWHESNTDDFIQKARMGEFPNAELDAITIRQLTVDLDRLKQVLKVLKQVTAEFISLFCLMKGFNYPKNTLSYAHASIAWGNCAVL